MLSNHHKSLLNLRFCPNPIVTLTEGVLTQDPWVWILSPDIHCSMLSDQDYLNLSYRKNDLNKLEKKFFLLPINVELYYRFVILRFRNLSSLYLLYFGFLSWMNINNFHSILDQWMFCDPFVWALVKDNSTHKFFPATCPSPLSCPQAWKV